MPFGGGAGVGRKGQVALAAGLGALVCSGAPVTAGPTCVVAPGADPSQAEALCAALRARIGEVSAVIEVVGAEAGRVMARLRWSGSGEPGPVVEMMAVDGPLLPGWPARLAADLLRATPPP